MIQIEDLPRVADCAPPHHTFAADVRQGLGLPRKTMMCKYFYDHRGASLFDRICELEEYYLTRTELDIMQRHGREMAAAIGPEVVLVEFGSGSATKTRILLDHLSAPAEYVPIDISRDQLSLTARAMAGDYPGLKILPVCADFTAPLCLPASVNREHRQVVYFPGSTIGNFDPPQAMRFLSGVREAAGPGGGLLIGVDLKKDPAILHSAYNDSEGITAEFNLNLLHRINRELDGTFEPDRFAHYAFYSPDRGRIEMHLVSRDHQRVIAAGGLFEFQVGESIFTESSYKYGLNEFAQMAAHSGLRSRHVWTDDRKFFSVQLFDVS